MTSFEHGASGKPQSYAPMHYGYAAAGFAVFYGLFAALMAPLQLLGMSGGTIAGLITDHPYLDPFINNTSGFLMLLVLELLVNFSCGAVMGLLFAFIHNNILTKYLGLNLPGAAK